MLSPYPWFATFAYLLLLTGFSVRRTHRDLHVGLMSAGMGLDLIVVLLLEFGRDAVATAMGPTLSGWQQTHVISSTLAVLFYIPVFILGFLRWRGSRSLGQRAWHVRLGYCALACRTVGFAFMFSIVGTRG